MSVQSIPQLSVEEIEQFYALQAVSQGIDKHKYTNSQSAFTELDRLKSYFTNKGHTVAYLGEKAGYSLTVKIAPKRLTVFENITGDCSTYYTFYPHFKNQKQNAVQEKKDQERRNRLACSA